MRTKTPLRWFGAKTLLARRLAEMLPAHDHYVEVMTGSAAVLFAKDRAKLETLNDIDANIVNFFRVLRDTVMAAELVEMVALTPYARVEFDTCRNADPDALSPVARAHRLLVVCNQAVGNAGQGWSATYRASAVSAARSHRWRMLPDRIAGVVDRLAGVQVESLDWRVLLDRYDAPGVTFFVDPPYHPDVRPNTHGGKRGYAHDFEAVDHEELVRRLIGLEHAQALVTHYPHAVYDELTLAGWGFVDLSAHADNASNGRQDDRIERVWSSASIGQLSLLGGGAL